jgi:hypothetical protein
VLLWKQHYVSTVECSAETQAKNLTCCVVFDTANYPEFLDRCVLINTPWVFNTFWYFVKGFLDEM